MPGKAGPELFWGNARDDSTSSQATTACEKGSRPLLGRHTKFLATITELRKSPNAQRVLPPHGERFIHAQSLQLC